MLHRIEMYENAFIVEVGVEGIEDNHVFDDPLDWADRPTDTRTVRQTGRQTDRQSGMPN